jgi:cytoskeletal protein RodZ
MSANTETVRRGSVPSSSTWIAVAVAIALAGAIVVVSLSGNGTTTGPTRQPTVIEQTTAGSPDSVAEMASLKSGAFERGPGAGDAVSTEPSAVSEALDIAGLKAALIERIIRGS